MIGKEISRPLEQQPEHVLNPAAGIDHIGQAPAFIRFFVKSLKDGKQAVRLPLAPFRISACSRTEDGRKQQKPLFRQGEIILFPSPS